MDSKLAQLQETVWDYYSKQSRDLPWRLPESDGAFDPYKIMVSEIMLQQTQVSRVIEKFHQFIKMFPQIDLLANAEFSEVLKSWVGLGYNRRAKYLHEAAKQINAMDLFPNDADVLATLPGIGKNTAAAICVYAYNQPLVFIETNIRTVFIHHFFEDKTEISDQEILPLVRSSVDKNNSREWYWALMDYGTHIKKTVGNVTRSSKHYVKQSRFEGSMRQVRSSVIKLLVEGNKSNLELQKIIQDKRLNVALMSLEKDGMIIKKSGVYTLA